MGYIHPKTDGSMDWDGLRFFHAAAQAGTLTAAAEALGVSQSTMSRRLASLEAQLGHALFRRSRGGLEPSEAARRLLPFVEQVAGTLRQATAQLEGLEAEPEGVVRVATMPGLAVDLLPQLARSLQARHPGLRLDIVSDTHFRDVESHEVDLALRTHRPERGDMVARKVVEVPIHAVASEAYVASLPDGARVHDLDWVQFDGELGHTSLARLVGTLLAGRPPALLSNDFLVLRAAVQAGLGCTWLPLVQARLAGLVPVEVAGLPQLRPVGLHLIVPTALKDVPRVRVTADFLADGIRALVADDGVPAPDSALGV